MDANRPATIYISAASDLMCEREALARMIAALPVTLAWHILQTPVTGTDSLDVQGLQSADLHLLIMGCDIRAPVGLEWLMARRAHRPVVAYLKAGVRGTPAGQVFINDVGNVWQPFADAHDLSLQAQGLLTRHLLRHATRFALRPDELAELKALSTSDTPPEQAGHGQETGHSAVLLSRERFQPDQGIVLECV